MTWINEASLVNNDLHSSEILELLELDINRSLIDYLVQIILDTVSYASGAPSTSQSRGRQSTRSTKDVQFSQFVSGVLARSEVTIGVLLVTIVYIHRSKPHLSIEEDEWVYQRVFLGALILAAKYTSDSTLKNQDWSLVTETFGKRDIGQIEREFLDVLDWDLSIKESDIIQHHASITSLQPRKSFRRSSYRPRVIIRVEQTEERWIEEDNDSDEYSPLPSPSPQTPFSPATQPASSTRKNNSLSNLSHLFQYLHTNISDTVLIPDITT